MTTIDRLSDNRIIWCLAVGLAFPCAAGPCKALDRVLLMTNQLDWTARFRATRVTRVDVITVSPYLSPGQVLLRLPQKEC